GFLADTRVSLAIFLQPEAVGEQVNRVASSNETAERRQMRLRLEPVQQHAQRLAEALLAEVVEVRSPARSVEQLLLVEWSCRQPGPAQHRPDGVRRSDGRAPRGLCQDHDGPSSFAPCSHTYPVI